MRIDPKPDPYVKMPVDLSRQPGRNLPKQVVVDSTRPAPRMRAQLTSSGVQTIPTGGGGTVVTFSGVAFDTVGLRNVNAIQMPSTGLITGAWYINGVVTWAGAASGNRRLRLRKNGTTVIAVTHLPGINNETTCRVSILVNDPLPTDFFELVAFQDSGADLDLLKDPEETYFEIIHLW